MNFRQFTGIAALAVVFTGVAQQASAATTSYFRTDTLAFEASATLGKQMFEAYQCAKCHAIREGQPLNDDIIAPNLILAKQRLRPEWILHWLIDPQSLQAGTKMPNYFFFNEDDDGNPIYSDPDAHEQFKIVVAIRDYLMVMGTGQEPGGIAAAAVSGR